MGYGDVEMIDANGIRNDGRKAGDVRPISIELGAVSYTHLRAHETS